MARIINKKKSEIGLGPDALIYRGNKEETEVQLSRMIYGPQVTPELTEISKEQLLEGLVNDSKNWININGVHNEEFMRFLSENLNLEEMVLSDVLNTTMRPKVEDYDSCLFANIKMLYKHNTSDKIISENVSIILAENYLLSFQEVQGDVFDPIRDRIRKKRVRITEAPLDYLMFAIFDVIIDNYMFVLTDIGEKIEQLEEIVFEDSDKSVSNTINKLKKDLTFLRKNIFPAREMIATLAKTESTLIHNNNQVHFNELQNNLNHVLDSCDSYREMLSDQLNIYHTKLSNSLNDTMQVLTVFSVIFIPLTFIAGIYGTNFENIPELHYQNAYFVMLLFMLIIALGMLWYFKKRNWLK